MFRHWFSRAAAVEMMTGVAFAQCETTSSQSTSTATDGSATRTVTSKSYKQSRNPVESYEWSTESHSVTQPVIPPATVEKSTTTTTVVPPPVVQQTRRSTTTTTTNE